MRYRLAAPVILSALLITGCGSSSGSKNNDQHNEISKTSLSIKSKLNKGLVAKNNALRDVKKKFSDKVIVVKTDVKLKDDDVDPDVVVLYGKIDDQNTNGLLAVNHKYLENHAKVSVEVYDNSGKLLAASVPKTLDKDPFYFGELTTK